MADDNVQGGNNQQGYKDKAAEANTEALQVRAWRMRIHRHTLLLCFDDRLKAAEKFDKYLDGTQESKNAQAIYLRYALPFLEEAHRRTLPEIGTPSVQARSEEATLYEQRTRQFLARKFDIDRDEIKLTCDDFQWDDDRFGCLVAKGEWQAVTAEANPQDDLDPEQIALQIEKAREENLDFGAAKISEDDIDFAHIAEHGNALNAMDSFDEGYPEAEAHIREHQFRMTSVTKERVVLTRIRPWQYVYDTDVPWPKRGWEAELQSVKIRDLIDAGYNNVNINNLPPEDLPEGVELPYEDMTARVWLIHDRHTHKMFVISADGPWDGKFLRRADWPYGDIDVYKMVSFRKHDPDQTWGTATGEALIPVLDELASVDFDIKRHCDNHSNTKIRGIKGEANEWRAQMNDPNQKVVNFTHEELALKAGEPIITPPIPPTLLQRRTELLNEIRRILEMAAQDVGAAEPHEQTATESAFKGEAARERKISRQEVMASLLTWYAGMVLRLHKRFATMKVPVRFTGVEGTGFDEVDPASLPLDYDIFLEVRSDTDAANAAKVEMAYRYADWLMASQLPIHTQKLAEWLGRQVGIPRPEQFRLDQPEGVENMQPTQGSPGMPGRTLQFPGAPGAQKAAQDKGRGFAPSSKSLTASA